MSERKKYYIAIALILAAVFIINIQSMLPYPTMDKNISMMYIKIAEQFSKAKMYEASNFYYKVAKKVSKHTVWLDYNIAKNIVSQYWKAPKSSKKTKKLHEAVDRLHIELAKHPNHISIWDQLGHAYYMLEDYDNAIKYYELSVAKDPNYEYNLHQLAYIYCDVKADYQKALEYADRAVAIKNDCTRKYYLRAGILADLERYEEAVAEYKNYLKYEPNNVAALVNISGCEIKIKDYENAEKHIEHGLKYNRYSAYLLSHKVDVLLHKHQFDEAKKIINQINRYYYHRYIGYWKLAKIERYNGNQTKADEYYRMANENAKEYYEKYCDKPYDLSDIDANCRNRDYAITHFEENRNKPLDF